ncbi:MAG: hypothetical protein U0840_12135 [Gemmataceae bacterium]
MSPPCRIILGCLLMQLAFAVSLDMVSVRLSREYFTVAHDPAQVPFDNPTWMALGWGLRAGAGPGAILGVVLALVSTVGSKPPLTWSDLRPGLLVLVGFMGWTTLACGLAGGWVAHVGAIRLGGHWGEVIPAERHGAFQAVACAHLGAYLSGIGGGITFGVWAGQLRAGKARENLASRSIV